MNVNKQIWLSVWLSVFICIAAQWTFLLPGWSASRARTKLYKIAFLNKFIDIKEYEVKWCRDWQRAAANHMLLLKNKRRTPENAQLLRRYSYQYAAMGICICETEEEIREIIAQRKGVE